jgi:hypothetical protein
MMNEATDVHHVAVVFRLCLNEEKMFPRCGTRSFTSPGVHMTVDTIMKKTRMAS